MRFDLVGDHVCKAELAELSQKLRNIASNNFPMRLQAIQKQLDLIASRFRGVNHGEALMLVLTEPRIGGLAPPEVVVARCPCRRSVEYSPGFLQRRHRLPSDFLVYDLQFRLRCMHCNARAGFRITIFDERARFENLQPRLERVVAAGE